MSEADISNQNNQELKYGMPKVLKSEFDKNPERYELRKRFPDLPACPWGNSFSMMGYDRQENTYVWLVKSIIKDDRLTVIEYSE